MQVGQTTSAIDLLSVLTPIANSVDIQFSVLTSARELDELENDINISSMVSNRFCKTVCSENYTQ